MTVYHGLLVLAALAFLSLWRERALHTPAAVFVSAALIFGAMALRALCMDHETLDYQYFLAGWVDFYRQNGGILALGESVGNYNVPYLYALALFSYADFPDLYLIKLLSVAFDVALAWAMLRLVRSVRKTNFAGLIAFLVTLWLPTVVLNGAYWGQCDSVYAALGLWGLAFGLERKPVRCVVFFALSFAFKLQAVFLLPVLAVLLLCRRIRWQHLFVFPLTYVIAVLPAMLAGKPFLDTVMLYFDQADSVGSGLNYNSPSVYAFLRTDPADPGSLAHLGIAAAFAALAVLLAVCLRHRKRMGEREILLSAALMSVFIPLLLPHMHDRYFFLADVLTVAAAFILPWMIPVPVLASFASLLGYHAYLRQRYLYPMRYGTVALFAVTAALGVCLSLCLRREDAPPARKGSHPVRRKTKKKRA